MKKIIAFCFALLMVMSLCSCKSTKTLDVAISGGADTASIATEKYYNALSSLDYDTLLEMSASLNKSCVQNTVAKYDETKYNNGIETMKSELKNDMSNVTITATVDEETIYDSSATEYSSFIKEYKVVCAGLDKIQNYAKVKVTLTYKEGAHTFTEQIDQNCIEIKDRWFVFDYSEEEAENAEKNNVTVDDANTATPDTSTEPVHQSVEIVGGGSSVEDAVKKYYSAISNKKASDLADVLLTMNKTTLQAVCGGYSESEYAKGLDGMQTEMNADKDKAVLTPTVSKKETHKSGEDKFNTFMTTHANTFIYTDQVKSYTVATVSLSIKESGSTDTFSASETVTCVQVDNSWFVYVYENN